MPGVARGGSSRTLTGTGAALAALPGAVSTTIAIASRQVELLQALPVVEDLLGMAVALMKVAGLVTTWAPMHQVTTDRPEVIGRAAVIKKTRTALSATSRRRRRSSWRRIAIGTQPAEHLVLRPFHGPAERGPHAIPSRAGLCQRGDVRGDAARNVVLISPWTSSVERLIAPAGRDPLIRSAGGALSSWCTWTSALK
jgi:hypothetical protein